MFFLIPIPLLFATSCSIISNYQSSIYVSQIIDGDTFIDQQNNRYRVLGIDTPEIYDADQGFIPTTGIKYFYGKLASNEAIRFLSNQWVEIEQLRVDVYDRKIARITLTNNIDYAAHMVQNGFAKVRYISTNKNSPFYYYDADYVNHLYTVEKEARIKKKGFWSESISNINQIFG